jgi:hypothetical protein
MLRLLFAAQLVAAAIAQDTQPPVISLDLVSAVDPTARALHNQAGAHYGSRLAHFADQCDVNAEDPDDHEFVKCFIPQAMAFDHHDGDLTDRILTTYTLFVRSDAGKTPVLDNSDAAADFGALQGHRRLGNYLKQRGEYIIEYNVEDTSLNRAETITYALLMRDQKAPISFYSPSTGEIRPSSLEYGSDSEFNQTTAGDVTDYYDQSNLKMGFVGEDMTDGFVHQFETPARGLLNKQCGPSKDVRFDYNVEDFADIFGKDNLNNTGTVFRNFNLYDNTPPLINAQNFASILGEASESDVIECTQNLLYPVHEPTDVSVTDSSCRCDMTKPTRVDDELYFSTEGGHCKYTSEADTIVMDPVPGAQKTAQGWSRLGTITIRIKAEDNPLVGETRTSEESRTLSIFDVSPPTLDMNDGTLSTAGTFSLTSDVGTKLDSSAHDKNRNSFGTGRYEGDSAVAQNIWSSQEEETFLHSSIIQHSAGYVKDAAQIQALTGYGRCTDSCGSDQPIAITTAWYMLAASDVTTTCDTLSQYQSLVYLYQTEDIAVAMQAAHQTVDADTFLLKYTCTDTVGNIQTDCRTIINQDHTRPIINPIIEQGNCPAGLEGHFTCFSSSDDTYNDEGAICSDVIDGDLSADIQVTMGTVDLTTVGSYFVQYDCEDSSGNVATSTIRTVIVLDETCPVCVVTTGLEQTIEASFPYDWAGDGDATCLDDMKFGDGVATKQVTASYHYNRRDDLGFLHDQVKGLQVDVEQTGVYYMTYTATDGIGNDELMNLFNEPCNRWVIPNHEYHNTRTITVVDTIQPIITLTRAMTHSGAGSSLLAEAPTKWSWPIIALGLASAASGFVVLARTLGDDKPAPAACESQQLNPMLV